MTTKEKIEVMQAFEDGKPIQLKKPGFGWGDLSNANQPEWNWERNNYRIKPIDGYPKVIPASLTELDVMANYSWFKFNSTPLAEEILHAPRSIITKKEGVQILNPTTKCWEDWSK